MSVVFICVDAEVTDLSQAILAHAYVLPISSSALRLLALLRDCASRELASSMSSGGNAPLCRGIRLVRACSTDLFMGALFEVYCCEAVGPRPALHLEFHMLATRALNFGGVPSMLTPERQIPPNIDPTF